MKNIYKNLVLIILLIINTLSTKVNAQHFDFEGGDPSSPVWTIYISEAKRGSYDLEAGDEIAIFDGDVMVGAFILDQVCTPDNTFDNDLIAFSVLTSGPGYTVGNPMSLKCWDASEQFESDVFTCEFLDPYGGAYIGDVFPPGDGQYSIVELSFDHNHIPIINYNPTFFTKSVAINSNAQDFLNIYSEGCGTLEWNIEIVFPEDFESINRSGNKENWLIVDPVEGLLDPGDSEIVILDFSAEDLEEGIYNADLIIFSNCIYYPEVIIPVAMTVFSPFVTQVFDLKTGFQLISSGVEPVDPDMIVVINDILNDNLDFVRNTAGQTLIKIGPNWVNNIGDWIIEEGYLIKMFADDSFSIVGIPIDPSSPIPLGTGFQFVSYFPEIPVDAIDAFATIIGNNLDFIRNSQGMTLRKIGPNWINGIGDCQPDEGYLVKMYADDILIYPFTCGNPFTDTRDAKSYKTVQIGEQCWMAENLNIGEMINGSENMTDNGVIEKYCYDNNPAICEVFGGLYQWNEMMEYVTDTAVQGICPEGWHLPTDHEWKILEGTVDSQYPVSNPIWSQTGNRGFDAGLNLKSSSGWHSGGNGSGLYGYEALPGGYHNSNDGNFYSFSIFSNFWSSTEVNINLAWRRKLYYNGDGVNRYNYNKNAGLSIRCLQDYSRNHTGERSTFNNLSVWNKNRFYELHGQDGNNFAATNFSFKGGNPAESVYTIYIEGLKIGDEIAAFDGDILIGSMKINSNNKFENELPVFSTLNNGQGYTSGNPLILKTWNKKENKEYVLTDYTFSNPYGDAWTENVFPEGDGEYSLLHFSTTGISDENDINQSISIYPNPSEGIFNILIEDVSGKVQIKVFDVHGNDYRFFEIEGTKNMTTEQLDLKELGAGIYFICFSGKDFNQVKKIIIQ